MKTNNKTNQNLEVNDKMTHNKLNQEYYFHDSILNQIHQKLKYTVSSVNFY